MGVDAQFGHRIYPVRGIFQMETWLRRHTTASNLPNHSVQCHHITSRNRKRTLKECIQCGSIVNVVKDDDVVTIRRVTFNNHSGLSSPCWIHIRSSRCVILRTKQGEVSCCVNSWMRQITVEWHCNVTANAERAVNAIRRRTIVVELRELQSTP